MKVRRGRGLCRRIVLLLFLTGIGGCAAGRVPGVDSTSTRPTAAYRLPHRLSGWPDASNTGVPTGTRLHDCASAVSRSGLYDGCRFSGVVRVTADDVIIERSIIRGVLLAGSGERRHRLVVSQTTIDATGHGSSCSENRCVTPPAVAFANFTLNRVNIFGSGHGVQITNNVVVVDSWIHDLCCLNAAHKDGIISNGGSNVVIDHNNVSCDVGSPGTANYCSAAIGLFGDYAPFHDWRVTSNLLNTTGSYCIYAGFNPHKPYRARGPMIFRNNVFGHRYYRSCGRYGDAADVGPAGGGVTWSNNGPGGA